MAANLRKAGQTIRKSFRTRSYTMFQMKDRTSSNGTSLMGNNHVNYCSESPAWRKRRASLNDSVSLDNDKVEVQEENENVPQAPNQQMPGHTGLRRGASVTQSMREAVGNLRQVGFTHKHFIYIDLDLYNHKSILDLYIGLIYLFIKKIK